MENLERVLPACFPFTRGSKFYFLKWTRSDSAAERSVSLVFLLTVMVGRKRRSVEEEECHEAGANRRPRIQETLDNCFYKGKSEAKLPSANDWKQEMLGGVSSSKHQS